MVYFFLPTTAARSANASLRLKRASSMTPVAGLADTSFVYSYGKCVLLARLRGVEGWFGNEMVGRETATRTGISIGGEIGTPGHECLSFGRA